MSGGLNPPEELNSRYMSNSPGSIQQLDESLRRIYRKQSLSVDSEDEEDSAVDRKSVLR